jgi:hypothetical protein
MQTYKERCDGKTLNEKFKQALNLMCACKVAQLWELLKDFQDGWNKGESG